MADKEDIKDTKDSVKNTAKDSTKKGLPTVATVGISLATLAVGVAVGHFALGGTATASSDAFTGLNVAESEVDKVIATYTYKGSTEKITMRDIIEDQTSLEGYKNDDDTYTVPTADSALNLLRNKIIEKDAEEQGIEVTDEDIENYAAESLSGTIAEVAETYAMTEDAVKSAIKRTLLMTGLRDKVVNTELPELADAPDEAEEGKEEEPTAEYAQYIINLVGDEWDSAANDGKGGWKSTDGKFAAALEGQEITNDSATYEAAYAAYNVVYQEYSAAQSTFTEEWTNYINGLLVNVNVNLSTAIS